VARRPAAAVLLLAGLLAVGVAACGYTMAASHPGHKATPAGSPTFGPIPKGQRGAVPGPASTPVAAPAKLIIPSLGVRSSLLRLGIAKDGTLQVPGTAALAGWFTDSARPGEIGDAVIAGHIDSQQGPGIFYHLHQLKPGQKVYVRRSDGSLAVFKVTAVHMYLKAKFPASIVYGAVPDAQLRLITCGGAFDPKTGHYLSNVIAFANLVH
jgi:sortase (surface protein transpeptidase)